MIIFEKAMEEAVRLLPKGYTISLKVESGNIWITLSDKNGDFVEIQDTKIDNSLGEQIQNFVSVAKTDFISVI